MSSEDLLDLDYDETPETIVTCQEWETSLDTSPRRFVSSGNDAHHKTSDDLARKRAERFGITPRKFVKILQSDIDGLYNELRVSDGDFNLRTVIVKGVDDMTRFAVEKIFAEYQPCRVEMFGNTSSLVHFASRGDAAKMLIGMTKTLRRIRAKKTAEDGEVVDSEDEDEEGQIKNEGGDDVAVVVHTGDEPRRVSADAVEVDIEHIAIPDGRWRVVTEHVPEKRLMITRFATLSEITAAHKRVAIDSTSRKRKILDVDDQGYSYSWSTEEKVRPGLNVFDDKGNELEWDYEHDTRFYEETKSINLDSKSEECGKDVPNAIKIKGRGVRKGGLLYGGSGSTLASDNIESKPLKRSFGRLEDTVDDVEEEDWEPDRRTSPTPQPWDKPRSRLTDRISRW